MYICRLYLLWIFIILSVELAIKGALNLINLLIGERNLISFQLLAEMQGYGTLIKFCTIPKHDEQSKGIAKYGMRLGDADTIVNIGHGKSYILNLGRSNFETACIDCIVITTEYMKTYRSSQEPLQ